MSRIGRYFKAAVDRKRYQIDYTDWLDAAEQVFGVVFAVSPVSLGTPLVIDDVQVLPTGLGVQYYVSGGIDGVTYEVTATLTTNQGPQIRRDIIVFEVKEP